MSEKIPNRSESTKETNERNGEAVYGERLRESMKTLDTAKLESIFVK